MKKTLFAALLATIIGTTWAQAMPAGLWKTIDDETKEEKSLVRINEAGARLHRPVLPQPDVATRRVSFHL